MTDNPADDARREAEERERWLFEAARVAKGVPLARLQSLSPGALAELLESDRLLKQYLDLVAHGKQVNGWTGEELEDARYRLSILFRQWTQEMAETADVILQPRRLDPLRMLLRFAQSIENSSAADTPDICRWLAMPDDEESCLVLKEWAGAIVKRSLSIQAGHGDE